MIVRAIALFLTVACLPICAGCGVQDGTPASGTAVIVGSIAPTGTAGKFVPLAQLTCPEAVVTLNGAAVDIEVDDACNFLIDNVQPAANVVLRVELPDLGVSGTIELADVEEAELIEILVEAGDDSLTISVLRRATPDPVDGLPELITDNNVTVLLSAGIYDQTLTVDGNNFTLVGEAGDGCDAEGWTVITGDVLVLKNNATFRNVRFDGDVRVEGNNSHFINSCFAGELIVFGNNTEIDDDDDGENEDDDDDDGENDDEDEDD